MRISNLVQVNILKIIKVKVSFSTDKIVVLDATTASKSSAKCVNLGRNLRYLINTKKRSVQLIFWFSNIKNLKS